MYGLIYFYENSDNLRYDNKNTCHVIEIYRTYNMIQYFQFENCTSILKILIPQTIDPYLQYRILNLNIIYAILFIVRITSVFSSTYSRSKPSFDVNQINFKIYYCHENDLSKDINKFFGVQYCFGKHLAPFYLLVLSVA